MNDPVIHVLYIEDNPHDRALVREILEEKGGRLKLTEAASRAAFEAGLKEEKFDLLLTDVDITGLAGLDVLEKARQKWPHIPVVILAEGSDQKIALEMMERGADIFVNKTPEDMQQLPAILSLAVEKARLREYRQQAEAELRQKNAELEMLLDLNQAVNRGEGLDQILQTISQECERLFGCFSVTIYLLSEDRQSLVMQSPGLSPDQIAPIEVLIGRSIPAVRIPKREESWYWEVLESGQPALTQDPEVIQGMMAELTENRALKKLIPKILKALGLFSVITVPLIADSEPIGVIDTSRREPFTDGDIQWMEHVACEVTTILQRQMLESELRASEDRYRDLVEHSRDLICTHDLEGNILSINPWFAKVLGYETSELLQANIRDFLVPEVRGKFDVYLDTITQHGFAQGLMAVQTSKGERRIWEYNNTLRTEGVPEPIVRGIGHDVTEQVLAKKALASRAAQLTALNTIIAAATRETDLGQFLETTLHHILQVFDSKMGAIWVGEEHVLQGLTNDFTSQLKQFTGKFGLDFHASVAIPDWEAEQGLDQHMAAHMQRFGIRASLTAPIMTRAGRIGGLSLAAPTPRAWTSDEIDLAEAIGHHLGGVAERLELFQEAIPVLSKSYHN